ncbi:MAG: MFS transporter [Myxococcota bacterium]|nr:MFS transporter [Myxococcota bacterium]
MPTSRRIPRNVWAASATSFLMDVSSEMVVNVLPLFLANVLGVRTVVIGLVEGLAEATASLLKVFSGSLSDRLGRRKPLAVAGYAISALAKPGFALATSWGGIAGARWADRVGKGVRTAPRDALVADAVGAGDRGLAFGLHRAADTGGAVVGLAIAIGVLALVERGAATLDADAFRTLVWVSLVPAVGAVAVLAFGVREVRAPVRVAAARPGLRGLGRPFFAFLLVSALFDLGNFSDAFLVLRAQERGLGVTDILWVLVGFNLVYAVVSTPGGRLSDRIGRRAVIAAGWVWYAAVHLGFAGARSGGDVTVLFLLHGVYYGLTAGTAKALIADLVPERLRGSAYGSYFAVMGAIDLPASLLAGALWQGLGAWPGFGPAAPFVFSAGTALAAAALLWVCVPAAGPARD